MKITKRALTLDVYRRNGCDCTNGGISSQFDTLLVPCESGPIDYDPEDPPENLVFVRSRIVTGCVTVRLVPAKDEEAGRWTMFGGNYATTSDSRFGEMLAEMCGVEFRFNNVLPVHDRIET